MSPYQKMTLYLSIALLLAFGWHFGTVLGLFGTAPLTQGAFFARIGAILGLFVAASFVTALVVGRAGPRAALPDEREEWIELRAQRSGVMTLYLGLLLLAWFAFSPMTPVGFANGLLAVVCVTEIVKVLTEIYYHRRGIG